MTSLLTDAQLKSEIKKCEYCEEKPCRQACPAHCSPADFIMAAKLGNPADYKRAASLILANNPLGGVCGAICPDYHCMKACVHRTFDQAVNIPAVQATIIQKAKDLKQMPTFHLAPPNGKTVGIVGGGPAGLSAAAVLAQKGYEVKIFEREGQLGGMCCLIPDFRLARSILHTDLAYIQCLGQITIQCSRMIDDPKMLLDQEIDAVIVCAGLNEALKPSIPGGQFMVAWNDFLKKLSSTNLANKNVAIVGGGAIAVDCAVSAGQKGAERIDLIYRRTAGEMPLTAHERQLLIEHRIGVVERTIITVVEHNDGQITGLRSVRVHIPPHATFKKEHVVLGSETILRDYDIVVSAIGSRCVMPPVEHARIIYAGDQVNGATSVVEAVASGKNAAEKMDAILNHRMMPAVEKDIKSSVVLKGKVSEPVSLETDFFGRRIRSPFLLSAAPSTDGYEPMKKAYEAGWAGGIMKTAFDHVPIHIPAEYMFVYNDDTYSNCDNVSGHPLDRVCREIERLIKEFPDRLTIGSTGGPVTGNDEHDRHGWQSNTRKLEQAGAMGVEYSLSCPQGGDGTEGDIVSQNAQLAAKITDWVMEASDPQVPKLFKLTSAVTSVYPIIEAAKKVFAKYPHKKAGITLANSFPTMAFRPGKKTSWDEGIITGMSGDAVKYISNLALANVSSMDVMVSGNGGPMDYKAAADFLALGVKTVQFCTIALKYGVSIVEELHSGLSYLLEARGFRSVEELIGCALPKPVTNFMQLSSTKKISTVEKTLCQHCGNCTRCPYLAITLNEEKIPSTDASKCVGCSLCVQKCFSQALTMRERTPEELKALSEG